MMFKNFKKWLAESIYSEVVLNFGLHRGKDHTDPSIPPGYLQWMLDNVGFNDKFKQELRQEIERRKSGPAATKPVEAPKPVKKPEPVKKPDIGCSSTPSEKKQEWILAKVKNLIDYFPTGEAPASGEHVVVTKQGNEWLVMTRDSSTTTINCKEIKNAIESVKGVNNQPLTSVDPEELWSHVESMGKPDGHEEPPVPAPAPKPPENRDESKLPAGRIAPWKMTPYNTQIEKTFLETNKNITINALAGTGKTTMLKHLASFKKPSEKWLYLVFNSKNQREATTPKFIDKKRPELGKRMPFPNGVDVLTTHSFCGRVLKMNSKSGRIPDTELPEGKGQSPKMAAILDDPWFDHKAKNELEIPWKRLWILKIRTKQLSSLGKNFLVNPNNSNEAMEMLDNLIDKYSIDTSLMDEDELMDADPDDIRDYRDEMVEMAYDVLRRMIPNSAVAGQKYNITRDHDDTLWWVGMHADELIFPRYNVVLADEVQDFNKNQQVMLQKLAQTGARIIAVGDPWQAIYRFRGADNDAFNNVEAIVNSGGDGGITHMLPINWRSGKKIIDHANKSTHMSELADDKRLQAGMDHDGEVTTHKMYSDVIHSIIDEWDKNLKKHEQDPEHNQPGLDHGTAILARTNAPLLATAMTLLKNGVQFQIIGREFFDEINKFMRQIVGKGRKATNHPIEEFRDEVAAYVKRKESEYKGKMKKQGELEEIKTIGDALVGILDYLEEHDWYDPLDTTQSRQIKDAFTFMDFMRERFGGLNVEENYDDAEKYEAIKDKVVSITTGHRSKGLEFDRVFIIRNDLYEAPKSKNDEELQQEKNGKYVAYTRAKKQLHVINDKTP